MSKRGENIYLRKDGRYEGRYIKGRKQSGQALFGYVYAKRYAEVKERLMRLKIGECTPSPVHQRNTLGEWMRYWLEEYVRPYVRETTYATYENQYRTHIEPAIGKTALYLLDKEKIQVFVNSITPQISTGMVHNVLRLLSSALRIAQNKGMIVCNPCQEVRLPVYKTKEPRVLTVVEQKKLERAAEKEGMIEYMLCLYTGLRVGELCALRWENVDFESNILYVRRTAKRVRKITDRHKTVVVMGAPKTEESMREIPIPAFLMAYLERIRKEHGQIFAVDVRTIQQRLHKLTHKVGLKGVHMHTLRHTFATRCLEVGVGVETLSALLGHSSPNITLSCYAHCTRETKIRSIGKLRRMAC